MFAHLLMSGVESGSKTRVRLEPVRFMLVGHMGELHTDVTRGHWKTSTWHSLMLDMGREEWKYSYAETCRLCYTRSDCCYGIVKGGDGRRPSAYRTSSTTSAS